MSKRIIYKYRGIDLSELGIVIKSSAGLTDQPTPRARQKYEWQNMDGYIYDADEVQRYEARRMTLNSTLIAESMLDFLDKSQRLNELMSQDGAGVLEVILPYLEDTPLVYYVIPADGLTFDKSWSAGRMAAAVSLLFEEPEPMKSSFAVITPGEQCKLTIDTRVGELYHIFGDGVSYEFTATEKHRQEVAISTAEETKYIFISGRNEGVDGALNLSKLWNF